MINAKNIQYSYGNLKVLKGVNLHINKGEFVSITGASGAGKTTLLNYLAGREISTNLKKEGNIYINGVPKSEIKLYSTFVAYV